jgi:transcriptional regulator with XRE-family HTH domain
LIDGQELRRLRRAAGIGLAEMAARSWYSKSYLGFIETSRKPVTETIVAAYEKVLGVGLHDDAVHRRQFLNTAASVAANAVLIKDMSTSLAGGDSGPLATVQTSHSVDTAIATVVDGPVLRKLKRWTETDDSPIVRVNAAGIIAKAPGQSMAGHVAAILAHDEAVAQRYLTAVVARLLGIDHPTAAGYVAVPTTVPTPMLAAQRFAAEVFNPNDAGARWCAATMLTRLSPHLGDRG